MTISYNIFDYSKLSGAQCHNKVLNAIALSFDYKQALPSKSQLW